jgi:hypothetical protein
LRLIGSISCSFEEVEAFFVGEQIAHLQSEQQPVIALERRIDGILAAAGYTLWRLIKWLMQLCG